MSRLRVWGLAALAVGGTISAVAVLNARGADSQSKAVEEAAANVPEHPDWNWDVRPILSQNCFSCHGKGAQKAGLRLDVEKSAFEELPQDKGKRAIVPGNPGKSELYKRIVSTDADYVMPTKDSHKTLSKLEIATIERWIKQGAHYEQHWAYIAPKEVKPQASPWDKQAVNAIDKYVYARLKKEGLSPSPEADRETLINRVTLDLTGLPPTLKEVDDFVADKSPNAYEKVVDRLLASRAYAERQANVWLDVARYADTNGGLFDQEAAMQFPYRDWVITAFQRNIPYDKFVTWQLAGDKLPTPTREQILATAFLRAGMKDAEMGSIDEEFRTNYMMERTELMGKAFMGLTVGCAKCHDHKYDVVTQADYYALGGFFNSIDESGLTGGAGPTLDWPTPTQSKTIAAAKQTVAAKQAAYNAALAQARQRVSAQVAAVSASQRGAWLQNAINADTQAYYPFDNGYKASFASLLVDPGPLKPGAPDPLGPPTKMTMTRQEYQLSLQNAVVAEAMDRQEHPEKYAALDKAKADAAAASAHAGAGLGPTGKPGGPGGLTKAAYGPGAPKPGMGPGGDHKGPGPAMAGRPGLMKASMGPGGPGGAKPGAPKREAYVLPGQAVNAIPVTRDPDAPRVARREIDKALADLVDKGFTDPRLADAVREPNKVLPIGLHEEKLFWTPSGLPGQAPGAVHNVQFIPGARGQGVLLHDSVAMAAKGVGDFERSQAYSLDLWLKLRLKDYVDENAPQGPEALILGDNGALNGTGYQLTLNKGKLEYAVISISPHNLMKVSGVNQLPRGRWIHITSTYDGSSKAAGMKLYLDGKPMQTMVVQDSLTRTARARIPTRNSRFGGYFGLSAGTGFTKPELTDSGLDELRVVTRVLTPTEVAYLQNPAAANAEPPRDAAADMADIAASKDPAVQKAWAELKQARDAEQQAEAPVAQIPVTADTPRQRTNHILDRGVFNTYKGVVPTQAPSAVFPWSAKYPANRLGLADWMFDAKNPLTARVYMNRMWQGHFGNGIVTTVDDFGTQGSNPTNPQLLDYLAVEFQRSGWDIKHMHKLMVMSASYRQSSNATPDKLEKDPKNLLVARGPRYRMSAEMLRDNALFVSGLLVDKVGGDAVFPYQPDLIWDGVAEGFVVYPYNVTAEENYRRSMYTFVRRNQGAANMVPFDMPDRKATTVIRTSSSTPLQALVLLNDPQFLEAYRKLAERSIKSSANPDQQLVTLFRLGARRYPSQGELKAMRTYRQAEAARAAAAPDAVGKLLAVGRSPADPAVDKVQLTAMTMVAAGVMNSPDAYTLR